MSQSLLTTVTSRCTCVRLEPIITQSALKGVPWLEWPHRNERGYRKGYSIHHEQEPFLDDPSRPRQDQRNPKLDLAPPTAHKTYILAEFSSGMCPVRYNTFFIPLLAVRGVRVLPIIACHFPRVMLFLSGYCWCWKVQSGKWPGEISYEKARRDEALMRINSVDAFGPLGGWWIFVSALRVRGLVKPVFIPRSLFFQYDVLFAHAWKCRATDIGVTQRT